MHTNFTTDRLVLSPLIPDDLAFIFELVNTSGWIEFIGDRNVKSMEDAALYIQKILNNPAVSYTVARLRTTKTPIGIVTLIKREYLNHHDIGFAFLPAYSKQGYAFEASSALLNYLTKDPFYTQLLATTVKQNVSSIRLLEKLGFRFDKEIQVDSQQLFLYSASADKILISQVITSFYNIFKNINGQQPAWDKIYSLCLPETIIIKKADKDEIYSLQTFIEPRKESLSNGSLTEFQEYETGNETNISGTIAQRFSKYEKKGILNGERFKESGTKMFQLIKSNGDWKMNAIVWEDDKK